MICRDEATQWMLTICLIIYFSLFAFLERRRHFLSQPPNLWLVVVVVVCLAGYAMDYSAAAKSLEVPVLLAGIVFSKVVSTWTQWLQGWTERRAGGLILWLVCLLAGTALYQPGTGATYVYHGALRWNGVWDNPNTYGLLMGVGLVLVVGMQPRRGKREGGGRQRTACYMLRFAAAGLCGFGLFKSYSRGAWLAVFVGLIYPAVQAVKASQFSIRFRRNWLSLMVVGVSLLVLIFWQFHSVETRPAQRIFSVTNVNDFSWRNRVAAWEGAAWMMVDRPWAGFGWGQAEEAYGKKYCPSGPDGAAAIEMNDYLMIGISAGVPAMICFLVYIGLVLKPKPEIGNLKPDMTEAGWVNATCRAGAVVLLVGFWFDGGLFKLPTAVVFWMLLELSRVELGAMGQSVSASGLVEAPVKTSPGLFWRKFGRRSSVTQTWRPLKRGERILRWVAVILAISAATETAFHLLPPHFSVSERTLAIARKILVQPKEKADFEALAVQPIWQGQKLKTLLEHVELAGYNRELINWKLDNGIYRDFVLSPVIHPDPRPQTPDPNLNWRRPLWEEFYPRIRHESSPEEAARIVVRHLRARVTVANLPNPPRMVPEIWLRQVTDEAGFQVIYIAALRSVGVPARLNAQGQAEFHDGTKWLPAPSPSVGSL